MSIFEQFKERVLEVRKEVEKFKDNHKMASAGISLAINLMPNPFNKFASAIWNGLEKQSEGGADPSAKLLEILEKIENNTEQSFSEIKTNISELIQFGVKTEDIQKLGEQIRISNESVIQNLKEAFNEELKKAAQRLEESFQRNLFEMGLAHANLKLVTPLTIFGKGSKDCWMEGYFREEDIKNGYDARRIVTDDVLSSIDKNMGTILYGRPYYGKSTILRRVMFEKIDNGYSIIFTDNVEANENDLIRFLDSICNQHDFPNVLIIADNVHKQGSEVLFKAFNKFFSLDSTHIKFLFSAREDEFDKKNAEVARALKKIQEFKLDFASDDALLFLIQALFISREREISNGEAEETAEYLYSHSKRDPFMFVYALIGYIYWLDERDIDKKIASIPEEDTRLWRAAILCIFMGIFGIKLREEQLKECGIYTDVLKQLAHKNLLLRNGEYKIRHERWSLEFMIQLYKEKFDNDFASFDARYKINDIIKDILNYIDVYDFINILIRCVSLFKEETSKPLSKIVIPNRSDLLLKFINSSDYAWRIADVIASNFNNLPSNIRNILIELAKHENPYIAKDALVSIIDNYNDLPSNVQQIIFEVANDKKGDRRDKHIGSSIVYRYNDLPPKLRDLLFKAVCNPGNTFDICHAIINNFDFLPNDVRDILLLKLSDNEASAVASCIRSNFDKFSEDVRNLLLIKVVSSYDNGAGVVAEIIASNFDKFSEDVRNLLLLQLCRLKENNYVEQYMNSFLNKMPNVIQILFMTGLHSFEAHYIPEHIINAQIELNDIFTRIGINPNTYAYIKFVLRKDSGIISKELKNKLLMSCDQSRMPPGAEELFLKLADRLSINANRDEYLIWMNLDNSRIPQVLIYKLRKIFQTHYMHE